MPAPHPYQERGGHIPGVISGCTRCGFGPYAAEHNAGATTWSNRATGAPFNLERFRWSLAENEHLASSWEMKSRPRELLSEADPSIRGGPVRARVPYAERDRLHHRDDALLGVKVVVDPALAPDAFLVSAESLQVSPEVYLRLKLELANARHVDGPTFSGASEAFLTRYLEPYRPPQPTATARTNALGRRIKTVPASTDAQEVGPGDDSGG